LIPTAGSFLRVGGILVVAVVLQISGVAQVTIFGASPNLVPLAVAGVAFFAGSVPGAITGFAAGLLLDLALGHVVGASSLVLSAVGYGSGRYREVRDPAHGLSPIVFAAGATAAYLLVFAAVSYMLGIEAAIDPLALLRDVAVTVVLNVLLALPVFWLLRRVLRGGLISDPTARRRRDRERDAGPIGLRGLEV
jgi:rod shape-determining protein MreD